MSNTKFVQLRGYIEWAKIFHDNRDVSSTNKGVNKMLKEADGQYKMNFYPIDDEELQKAKDTGLSEELYGGGQRFKHTGNFGCGRYFELKRKNRDMKEVKNKETGELEEVNFGGPVEVVWFNEEKGYNTPWNRETDGNIGNGSEVVVKFSVYGEGTGQTVRLIKVGVVKHLQYEMAEGNRL